MASNPFARGPHNIGLQRTRTRVRAAEAGSFGGVKATLIAFALVAGASIPSQAQNLAVRKDAAAVLGARITVFRLNGSVGDKPPATAEKFHGWRVLCKTKLPEAKSAELTEFLGQVATRQEEEAKEPGVAGGVPGCEEYDLGVRFETTERTAESFVCLHCGWMFVADRTCTFPSMLYVFSEAELQHLISFFVKEVPSCSNEPKGEN